MESVTLDLKDKKTDESDNSTSVNGVNVCAFFQQESTDSDPFATIGLTENREEKVLNHFDSKNDEPTISVTGNGDPESPSMVVDDPFSASLRASESDRRHDAWIPSEETRRLLKAAASSIEGNYFPDREQLTMLGIILEEDLVDPVRQLMAFHMGQESTSRRVTLTADDVSQDVTGLKQLLDANCCRAAVNLTGRLLVLKGQGVGQAGHPTKITPDIIQIWFVRIALLIKLREFAIAEVEAVPFGNCEQPDLYYEFYPDIYGARKGSMVPFAFRVILAELPMHLNQFSDSLAKLHSILQTVQEILNNLSDGKSEDGSNLEMTADNRKESKKVWEERKTKVMFSILNCLLAQKDFPSAVKLMQEIIEENEEPSALLYSLKGRIFLQLGDISGATNSFGQARSYKTDSLRDTINELINNALMAIAQNEFEIAFTNFKEANELEPGNPLLINNMAVCLLYVGRLKDALKILEGTIYQIPNRFLHEGILFNVCTLYELESSHSSERKQTMLNMVGTHVGDGFNVTCLKLPLPT